MFKDNGDSILAYAAQLLSPILGDHRYSSRVKTLMGKPVLVPDQRLARPEPQVWFDTYFY